MRIDQTDRQRATKRARRWSLVLAVMLHSLVLGAALQLWSRGLQNVALQAAEPMLSGELVSIESLPPVEIDDPIPPTSRDQLAFEPSAELVQSVAARILNEAHHRDGHSLSDVREKAELLDRISNADEIKKMADHLRSAIGTDLDGIDDTSEDAPPVDWNRALPVSAKRVEADGSFEVHEVFADPDGGRSVMIHARITDGDHVKFTTCFIERGQRSAPVQSTKAEFELALARIEPLEMMQDYPLLQELHRSAILPILHKLAAEQEAKERAQRGKPVALEHAGR